MKDIKQIIETDFSSVYTHFKEFQQNGIYRPYWDKCMEAVSDKELLSHIVFCNGLFGIPPVKTFLLYYKKDFIELTSDPKAELPLFIKKSIGAFWGMVFKVALGYTSQKSVSVSMYDYFVVKTATCFIK